MICRKCVQRAVKEPETEGVTSQEKKVLTEEEEKKRADSLCSGMVVTDQSFELTFGQFNNGQNLYLYLYFRDLPLYIQMDIGQYCWKLILYIEATRKLMHFKTCYIISVLFSIKYSLFHNFIFFY